MASILVADDSDLIREMVSERIGGIDEHEIVATAVDGEEAIEAYREHAPDIVILDVKMPALNGPEVADRIGLRGNSSLIFLSGDSLEPDGNESILAKPLDDGELEQVLNEVEAEQKSVLNDVNHTEWEW